MNDEELRSTIARNIAFYRKEAGHTQSALGDMLQYSDKSVSKWERGDGIPDIYVLYRIAALYHITVNDLLDPKARRNKAQHRLLVLLLANGLAWLLAVVAFFALTLFAPDFNGKWLCFIFALPACGVINTVFTALWYGPVQKCAAVSFLIWSVALSVHLSSHLSSLIPPLQLIYVVAGVLQLLCILWYILIAKKTGKRA